MSSTTDEERREAAANLRKIHLGGANKDLIELMLSDAIGARHENGISWDYITERLADLIDPICQEVPMESVGRWPFYTGIDLHLEMVSYGCSVCGYPWGEIDKWAAHGADRLHNSPKYCPNCGCRVVKGVMR